MGWIAIIVLLIGGLALVLKGEGESVAGLDEASFAGLVAGVALLIYLSGSLLKDYQGRFTGAVRDIAVWIGIALLLVAAYAFRHEFAFLGQRVAGELLPPGETVTIATGEQGERSVRIRRRPDGHFIARTEVNGSYITMLIDTGATTLTLKASDAKQAGINTDSLNFSIPVRTANGLAYAAGVKLRSVAVGPIVLRDIEALVAKPGVLSESLLGLNFLRRLRSYEFSGDFLTLRG
ncbi:MAG: hypothetical protein RLZ98_3808 [Pseudomonadota bacterium]|jgi:aspartyl protease family protein